MAELSRLPQVRRVAAQTNLSGPLDWVTRADPQRLALWCTYHTLWTTEDAFLTQCDRLVAAGVSFSDGVFGQPDHLAAAQSIRAALPASVYVWINAVKAIGYTDAELAAWRAIDPLFELNTQRWPSLGRACGAGERAITVDGDGTMRRCHFIAEPIGNLYEPGWDAARSRHDVRARNTDCHCYIGYAHLDYLVLDKVYARRPARARRRATLRAGRVRLPQASKLARRSSQAAAQVDDRASCRICQP